MEYLTKYETFVAEAKADWDAYRERCKSNGIFEFAKVADKLETLQNKINYNLLVYLYGESLGRHLANKFVENDRNLLRFLSSLDQQYRFFLLYSLENDEYIFVHC